MTSLLSILAFLGGIAMLLMGGPLALAAIATGSSEIKTQTVRHVIGTIALFALAIVTM